MITNKLLKNLMIGANATLFAFIFNFVVGWFICDDMTSMLTITLPFIVITMALLIATTILEDIKYSQCETKKNKAKTKIIRLKQKSSIEYYNMLRKVC